MSTLVTRGPRRRGRDAARYVLLSALALVFLLPFYVILRNALATPAELASASWVWWPADPSLDNLRRLFADQNVRFARSLLNSAVVSVLQTVLTVAISAMAGYGLARVPSRASRLVLGLTVLTLMVPTTVTFVPTFVMVSSLGWISSLRGLVVPVLFSAFATFLFRQFFSGFPVELEEAAAIDGAGRWRTFTRVVLPNAWGICAAVGTITFLNAWNSFLWPLLIGQDPAYRTVQVALSAYTSSQRVDTAQVFTGSAVAILPVLVVFVVLQRQLVQGVERSGID
ncbi:carbohydrate ABC transporter membrane protein 2, CUT1 family [Microlunatus sagamiharensis]|uniref:Carbohydrate ABC transporter membrane protein 2, CUT1 family n=1 Tax=Microlunatus sagamiharensis TaxID=546874 RepID=A0A1H2LTX2_9ACTN|nr:carbohydrate ABC transporter permease [Microlunatus sagamiharensis]SDU84138.1 carbohydrate ABC transporter membrane protein 2, CUT1 family [Microlunatus sagamiharensis]